MIAYVPYKDVLKHRFVHDPFLQGITWDNCQCLPTLLYNEVVFFLVDVRKLDRVICKPQSRCQVISRFSKLYLICLWWMLRNVEEFSYLIHSGETKKCFTSSYPHHDIYTFCYWQIFWHSIWHIFWHFIWHIFWHSIWHIFWHSTWHIFCNMFWHIFWHIFWHSIWQIFWHMFWQTFRHFIWHTFWHSIWHTFWHSIWHIFWHFIWHIISSGTLSGISFLAFFLTFYLAFYLAYLLAFYLAVEVQRCSLSSEGPWLRSSGAHWARRVPGWGPAVLTELGRSQVEVQRCSLSSEGPRLRSSGAQCAQTLAVEVQQCPLRAEVGEELGEKLARRKWTWEWMQRWWRRSWRRGRRRRRWRMRRRRRRTTVIKSNQQVSLCSFSVSIALAFCADSGFVWVPHVPNVPNHLSIARSASSRGKGSVLGFAQWTCHGRMG